jgi:hypothetical protein
MSGEAERRGRGKEGRCGDSGGRNDGWLGLEAFYSDIWSDCDRWEGGRAVGSDAGGSRDLGLRSEELVDDFVVSFSLLLGRGRKSSWRKEAGIVNSYSHTTITHKKKREKKRPTSAQRARDFCS